MALLTIPTPGAALTTNSTWPNMMYHFEAISGESPAFATVKEAPFESYEGEPVAVKESEAPEVKSIVTAFPRAVFGGQLPIKGISKCNYQLSRNVNTACEWVTVGIGLSDCWCYRPCRCNSSSEECV